jgi:hypothetical protein
MIVFVDGRGLEIYDNVKYNHVVQKSHTQQRFGRQRTFLFHHRRIIADGTARGLVCGFRNFEFDSIIGCSSLNDLELCNSLSSGRRQSGSLRYDQLCT